MEKEDDFERLLEEEQPGPADLESALVTITLNDVVQHTPLIVEYNASLAAVIEASSLRRCSFSAFNNS